MSMFCYQCQETARNTGCTVRGTCGKNETVAKLQDLLIDTLKDLAQDVVDAQTPVADLGALNDDLLTSLFMTITNANFDDQAIEAQIRKMARLRDANKPSAHRTVQADQSRDTWLARAESVGILTTADEDIRSLRELIIYGLKGMAAYAEHAANLGARSDEVLAFIYQALAATRDDALTAADLVDWTLRTGSAGVQAMALLDQAHTDRFGHPEITQVSLDTRNNPAILISGHDLADLEQLLAQSQGSGVDIYTHGEMLPAHAYPAFKQYSHLVGNYGNAWWQQLTEFESFQGPVLFTTNCIVPPRQEAVRQRIFTTGAAGYPGCRHIQADANGRKDFSELIALAKGCPPPQSLETGSIAIGFAHQQVLALADTVLAAVQSGAIRSFFVMAGCDGRMKDRSYYTAFAQGLPQDTIILTAGCAKYRYNKLDLGDIGGIPRVLDAGQCNDSYSLVRIALALQDALGLADVNDLPITYNIAWYEQKAVIVLLALLSLGVKHIQLGPTLPAFLSPAVAQVLVDRFGLSGIGSVEGDLARFLA